MNHSTGKPTKAEAARFAKLKALACVACALNKRDQLFGFDPVNGPLTFGDDDEQDGTEPQIHHFLSGNKRRGHDATAPLCYWHHQGKPYDGTPSRWFLRWLGPSFHAHTAAFRSAYGADDALIETTNQLIGDNA